MKPKFITLTYGDFKRLIRTDRISAINSGYKCSTDVYVEGVAEPLKCDQSPAQILALIQEAE